MREPTRFSRAETPRKRAPSRTKPPAKRKRRRGRRPPGGKALARLNMFLRQRGVAPEPTEPPPPVVPGDELEAVPAAPASAAADLIAAYAAMTNEAASATGPHWQPLGPFYMPHGQSYGEGTASRPSVAGRVSAIAIDPSKAQHVLCGAAGGGVWETFDDGGSWAARTDDQPSISIGAIAYDPNNPQRVYAGTGEGNDASEADKNVRAAGLLVSDDGGTTWTVMPGGTFVGVAFFDIKIDPADSQHIFAATTNGLYESRDTGSSWLRRRTKLTWSVSLHPSTPGNPAASREVLAGCSDGVFRSKDGGAIWRRVAMEEPVDTEIMRVEVRHAPTNGSVAYILAAHSFPDNENRTPLGRFLRRATFGGAFAREIMPADFETEQAWYDWFLGVAPNNPDVVYVGGINAHRGIRHSATNWSWTNISAKPANDDCIHPDQHTIAFGPADSNVVYIGNDGGLYRSPDAGVSWRSLNKGLGITEIEFLAQHPDYDTWLLAGTQDNGTIRYEGQQTWYHVQDGDGGDCGVDQNNPYTCYHSFWGPQLEKSTFGGGWNEWQRTTGSLMENEGSIFYPPLDVNGDLVVRGATQVWISRNAGANWRSHALADDSCVSAVTAPTPQLVYAGAEQGKFYKLTLQGSSWQVTQLTSPAKAYVSDIVVHPADPNKLWCTTNVQGHGRVFYSQDGGATWANRSTGLPGIALHAIEVDGANPDTLFVGTDVGVYRTRNGGGQWSLFGRGLPNVLVKDVLLHPKSRLLRAGTQARGVWEIPVDDAATPAVRIYLRDHAADSARVQPSLNDVPNPFARGSNVFWWQSPDIKIDASPFRTSAIGELDYDIYCDDRLMSENGLDFSTGLKEERAVRGQTARVYVQVHNRGSEAARNVAARVLFLRGALTWPDLPNNFWNGFPNNPLPQNSPWQPIAAARMIERIETGRSAIVGFDWQVPLSLGNAIGLLAAVTAVNDVIAEATLNVNSLVRNSRFCALRNVAVMNPPPLTGPPSYGTVVKVLAPPRGAAFLELDENAQSLVRALLMSKATGRAARKAGWKEVELSDDDATHIDQIISLRRAELTELIDVKKAFHPDGKQLRFALDGSQPVLLLFRTRSTVHAGSVVVRDDANAPIGGITIVNRRGRLD